MHTIMFMQFSFLRQAGALTPRVDSGPVILSGAKDLNRE